MLKLLLVAAVAVLVYAWIVLRPVTVRRRWPDEAEAPDFV